MLSKQRKPTEITGGVLLQWIFVLSTPVEEGEGRNPQRQDDQDGPSSSRRTKGMAEIKSGEEAWIAIRASIRAEDPEAQSIIPRVVEYNSSVKLCHGLTQTACSWPYQAGRVYSKAGTRAQDERCFRYYERTCTCFDSRNPICGAYQRIVPVHTSTTSAVK